MENWNDIPVSAQIIGGLILAGVIYLLVNFVFIGPSGNNPDDIGCANVDCY